MEHAASYVKQLLLNDEELEEYGIVKGGYPMLNIINAENLSYQILGGGKSVTTNRFEDLVIPLSLDTHYIGGNNEAIIEIKPKKNKIPAVLDDDRFNRIFDSIILIKKHREKETKRNNVRTTTKPTRKLRSK